MLVDIGNVLKWNGYACNFVPAADRLIIVELCEVGWLIMALIQRSIRGRSR